MTIKVRLRPEAAKRIIWGSNLRTYCAMCFGPLPEIPFMLWKHDGSGASLCDYCADLSLEIQAEATL